jgi:hypothetical protein
MEGNQQIIKDNKGNKIGVFLPIEAYEKILDRLEELEDMKAYDEYKTKKEETIPLRDAIKQRKRKNG